MLDQKIRERISSQINDKVERIMDNYEKGIREVDSGVFTDIIAADIDWHFNHDYFVVKIVKYYIERINDRLGHEESKYLETDLKCLMCGAFSKIIRQKVLEELHESTLEIEYA